jgi:uncharacterized protein (DUF362 family)
LIKSTYKDINNNLSSALAGKLSISNNDSVIIKINLCGARLPGSAAITHPIFLDALLRFLRNQFDGLKIFVVESDATTAQPDLLVQWLGFRPILNRWNASYVNLSKEKTYPKKINGRFFTEVNVPQIFENSFFITLPKLKTNIASSITCCLKNQFGCLPEAKKIMYHGHLDDVIVDSNLAMKPDFCLVDAIMAMGGDLGPGLGTPIPLNAIIYGQDPVAIDAMCAKLMGFKPWRIGHIRKSAEAGIGNMSFKRSGDAIPKVDFEISPFNVTMLKIGSWLSRRNSKN